MDSYPDITGRRLRLIYLGRVLPNGIRLASWLDASAHEDEQGHTAAMLLECETLDQDNFTMKRAPNDGDISDKQRGKQRLIDFDMVSDGVQTRDVLCLPTAFLQCSIGPSNEEAPPTHEIPTPNPTHEARGFDRLRYTAGMSALDVQTMREQFHLQSGLSRAYTGDLIRQEDEQDYAYRLEEQWIDNMGTAPIRSDTPSMSLCILQGLMIGFFFPLVRVVMIDADPLFFHIRVSLCPLAPPSTSTVITQSNYTEHRAPSSGTHPTRTAIRGARGTEGK